LIIDVEVVEAAPTPTREVALFSVDQAKAAHSGLAGRQVSSTVVESM